MRALRLPRLLAALVALAGSAAAQDFVFQIQQSSSNFQWSGTTDLGALQGNPNTTFQLAGTLTQHLDAGGNPVAGGQWLGANALVIPDLSGVIPNPLIFLPPLAQVDITGMSFTMTSTPFVCSPSGTFACTTTLVVLTGTLTVTPLTGSPTVTNLAGTVGPPSVTNGTITASGGVLTMTSPMNTNFAFTDPTSNISGTFNLVGTTVAKFTCPPVSTYCTTSPNSVGAGVLASTTGSTSITANDLVLIGTGAPANQWGIFYYGPNQISAPFGNGVRCVGAGGIGTFRLPLTNSGPSGTYTRPLDHNTLSHAIAAGETWNFQCWYRDPAGGGAAFNLSDGVSVFFCP
ncbi:MAG: hypothetical protein H6828_08955 [Planctomycetes bacterium]|nr:hypothetical protein [Planctomycetota bacterium]